MYAQAESAGVLSVRHSVSQDEWLLDFLWVDYYSTGSEILGRKSLSEVDKDINEYCIKSVACTIKVLQS